MVQARREIPWWVRLGAKLFLARLPIKYSLWKRFHLFEHGNMDQPERAFEIFISHAKTAGVLVGSGASFRFNINDSDSDFTVLELGPGDSLFSAIVARQLGATNCWLVDAGDFASKTLEHYFKFIQFLSKIGFQMPALVEVDSFERLLDSFGAKYLVQGKESLRQIPSNSVDYIFSNAVLEHIPRADFHDMVDELARILKFDGVSVHRVDLKDHIGGGLNNLRFSDSIWESELFCNSGFYTNRIRYSEMLHAFQNGSLAAKVTRIIRFSALPISRDYLNHRFQKFTDDDLSVSGFDLFLKKQRSLPQ